MIMSDEANPTPETDKPKTEAEKQRDLIEKYSALVRTDKKAAAALHDSSPFLRQTFSHANHT